MDYVKLTDQWQWDVTKLQEATDCPTIYKSYHGLIYLFFIRPLSMRRHDILCYVDYKRCFNINLSKMGSYCNFCVKYKTSYCFNYDGESFCVCMDCYNKQSPYTNIYVNNKFTDPYYAVSYILNDKGYHFFYRMIVHEDVFNFKNIVQQPWYQLTKNNICIQCEQNVKYYNSWCKPCYDFAYDQLYNKDLCKYYLIKHFNIITDIIHIISNLYLMIIDFPINPILKPKVIEPIAPIKQIDILPDEDLISEDWITEDNVDEYLDNDVDDELGTWSDDEL